MTFLAPTGSLGLLNSGYPFEACKGAVIPESPNCTAKEMTDTVGECQPKCAPDDDPKYCTTGAASAYSGADCPGDAKGYEHGEESHRHSPGRGG